MYIIALILLGLCLGSFINALVWRLHEQTKTKAKRKDTKLSIVHGHSMCPHCKHPLAAKDLVPLLSWLELRGRCRYCHASIGWQYPLVELLTAGLFVLSYVAWPFSFSVAGWLAFGLWLVCLVVLIALAVYDLRWMLLPNRLVYPLTGLVIGLVVSLSLEQGSMLVLWRSLLGGVLLSGLFWGLFQLSAGRWIGGGDVKLALALGLIAGGLVESVLVLFIASLLGSFVGVPLLITGRTASHKLPFGPFLIVATVVVFLWGGAMIAWYSQLVGL